MFQRIQSQPVVFLFILVLLVSVGSCSREQPPLPILGHFEEAFALTDQGGQTVTPETFAGKIYVADFFFTTCPTICPIMKSQMVRIYEAFKDDPRVLLLSHTIDPGHDTVDVLHAYAQGMQVDRSKWHFVTGPKDIIYPLAKSYALGVLESEQAPGGYIHSGSFCLVDQHKQIRGYYNGTDPEEVDQLMEDMEKLLRSW